MSCRLIWTPCQHAASAWEPRWREAGRQLPIFCTTAHGYSGRCRWVGAADDKADRWRRLWLCDGVVVGAWRDRLRGVGASCC